MRHRLKSRSKLRLEPLESRVMLATTGAPPAPEGWEAAIEGNPVTTELLWHPSAPDNAQVRISGPGTGDLTVNLDLLPDSVVNLLIKDFTNVSFVGTGTIDYLTLMNIGKVDAPGLSIDDGMVAYDVQHIRIDTAPTSIALQGEGRMMVGEKTLLEVNNFSSNPGAMIIAWVETFGLATHGGQSSPSIVSVGDIFLNFQPNNDPVVSSPAAPLVISGSDFQQYVLGSPEERSALDQSPTITRSPALVEHIEFVRIRSNVTLPFTVPLAVLGDAADTHVRPINVEEVLSQRVDGGAFANREIDFASEDSAVQAAVSLDALLIIPEANDTPAPAIHDSALSVSESIAWTGPQLPADTTARSRDSDAELPALTAVLARLAEPLADTMMNLQGHFATFGDMATAQVSSQMRTETRSPLLVDARLGRNRDEQEFAVVQL